MNLQKARANMVKSQIQTWGVFDEQVLELFAHLSRQKFVPNEYQAFAYADCAIPLPHGQLMFSPKEEARILQALQVRPQERVLVIGAGAHYLVALLSRLAAQVYALDVVEQATEDFMTTLHHVSISNVSCVTGDLLNGWPAAAPYDVIVLTGSLPKIPAVIQSQLQVGGRLFAVLGDAPVMEATVIKHRKVNEWAAEKLFETNRPRLEHYTEIVSFVF